ncbi:winged helix-turn-helix domain-containing protein [Bacillus pumilus]|uniref:winged helix-turn-helix domain-containing protein n=1 Tax=Bacillus pumilus TaxID=1408 RepID=UPI003703D3EF
MLELTPTQYHLLLHLLNHHHQLLTTHHLLTPVWPFHYFPHTNLLHLYIPCLTKKLHYPFQKQLIPTLRGLGYVIKR